MPRPARLSRGAPAERRAGGRGHGEGRAPGSTQRRAGGLSGLYLRHGRPLSPRDRRLFPRDASEPPLTSLDRHEPWLQILRLWATSRGAADAAERDEEPARL